MKNKVIIPILVSIIIVVVVVLTQKSNTPKVGLVYIADAEAIDLAKQGLVEQLEYLGLDVEIEYANAFGELKNINSIVNTFRQKNHKAILALTTPCAQIAQQQIKEQPIIFVGVSDPIGAGLVKELDRGFENVTGTMSKDPVYVNIKFAKTIFPDIQRVGIIYSANEANSQSIITMLEDSLLANQSYITLVKRVINQTTDIFPVANSLIREVDAVFLINDNTVASASELIINLARNAQKPIFSCDIESVKKGALFTYGLNYKDEGIAAANILKKILVDKIHPSEIPVFVNSKYYLYINKELFENFSVNRESLKEEFIEVK